MTTNQITPGAGPAGRNEGPLLLVRGRLLDLGARTHIMGIVNVTPDSFSDGGRFLDPEKAVDHALRLAEEGADILDIGGESTRPGAEPVDAAAEIARTAPVIRAMRKHLDIPLSIDTTKAEVAQAAFDAGADIVNDISALRFDPEMAGIARRWDAPVILMHMQGVPRTMQEHPAYADLFGEIGEFFEARIADARAHGITQILIDPGIGFGKNLRHNLELLNGLDRLLRFALPVVVGVSRKSFIGRLTGTEPGERLEGTIAGSLLAAARGAHIVRVHDVAPLRRALLVGDAILHPERAVER